MNTHDIKLPPHDATASHDGMKPVRLYSEAKVRAAIEADRKRRGGPVGRNAREAIHGLQGSIAVGSDGEWVSIRRDARDTAIQRLLELSDDCAHLYESYRMASDRADRSRWPTDAMVVLGAEVLHDGLRSLGVDLDEDFRGTTLEQGIAESVFSSMMDLAPQPDDKDGSTLVISSDGMWQFVCRFDDSRGAFITLDPIQPAELVQSGYDTPYNLGWAAGWDAHKRANPVVKESLTTAEPVKVPSNADILIEADKWSKEPAWCDFEHNDFIECVRALLAKYGSKS